MILIDGIINPWIFSGVHGKSLTSEASILRGYDWIFEYEIAAVRSFTSTECF